ncbi:6230_t:CDS:10, partial [Funneliformis caledonium]
IIVTISLFFVSKNWCDGVMDMRKNERKDYYEKKPVRLDEKRGSSDPVKWNAGFIPKFEHGVRATGKLLEWNQWQFPYVFVFEMDLKHLTLDSEYTDSEDDGTDALTNKAKEICRAYVYFFQRLDTPTIKDEEIENYCEKFEGYITETFEGEWIIQLSCLIPIQIAIARNNLFQPLKDGLSSNDMEHDDGSVKVVSSMGEQSCGKSFDGSAMRCVDGVWMSLADTGIQLYEDSSSFVELSDDLREYIVERRVALVTDWYGQNTTNFPQDNSDIVNGRLVSDMFSTEIIKFYVSMHQFKRTLFIIVHH